MVDLERSCPTAAHWSEPQYQELFQTASNAPQRLVLVAEDNPDDIVPLIEAGVIAFKCYLGETIGKIPPPSDGVLLALNMAPKSLKTTAGAFDVVAGRAGLGLQPPARRGDVTRLERDPGQESVADAKQRVDRPSRVHGLDRKYPPLRKLVIH